MAYCDEQLRRAHDNPIAIMIELLQETLANHRDPQHSGYNECETGPCFWCELAETAIKAVTSRKH